MENQELKLYVSMTDKFMSGWGRAEGKISKFVVECSSWAQADEIEFVASHRPDMVRVKVSHIKPNYSSSRYHVSLRTYEECSGWRYSKVIENWKGEKESRLRR
ncbi:MAG: hypothetical protein MJZ98_00485 [Paludibacteraceae bacterium]|nr:hypothetical protein [Paludibacteraceae bacterium]